MAAYAAATSLLNLLEQIQSSHARRPIFLYEQLRQLAYLHGKVSSLQSYLENYHNGGGQDAESLENRIADASYAAEDIIEYHIVDDIQDRFSQRLEKIVEEMESIEKEVMQIKEKSTRNDYHRQSLSPINSSIPPPSGNVTMVGFRDELRRIIDKLSSEQRERQIISITGMGGIGKTTLAKNAYDNPTSAQHFVIRGWVAISEEYDMKEVLISLLRDIKAISNDDKQEGLDYRSIGLKVHKYLSQRRYLIVLDDMWSIEAWEQIQLYLPDNTNGSRILVTSRLLTVANYFGFSNHIKMNLLDENESWSLLSKKVFVQESCPLEFDEIGKRISKNCKGLPLTIVVIGGLLAKSKMMVQYWEDISEDISKIVKSEGDDRCFQILFLSYDHLPIHLKPCFMYMGVFREDDKIRISKIIKLWVAEGFIKPIYGKSMEEVAEDYLKDLIDRNLILVDELGFSGKIKFCKIHDLLRDLCLREAGKCRFFCLVKDQSNDIPLDMRYQRRVAIHGGSTEKNLSPKVLRALHTASAIRSCVCDWKSRCLFPLPQINSFMKLLRVLDVCNENGLEDILQLVNVRYLNVPGESSFYLFRNELGDRTLSTSDHIVHHRNLFWYVQTLVQNTYSRSYIALPIIWEMPQLRHIMIDKFRLPDPPSRVDGRDIVVLENLQTVRMIDNFRCTKEVLKRMPNIKILKILIGATDDEDVVRTSLYSLNNLCHLHKLHSLKFTFAFTRAGELTRSATFEGFLQNVKFPPSLKKLSLTNCYIKWDDMGTLIGGIPQLERLKLHTSCTGEEWSPYEGQFDNLKFLEIYYTDLVQWNADSFHFPCLEHLVLYYASALEEIPPEIGEIATLQSIRVHDGNSSLVASAKKILAQQQELGNEDLRVRLTNGIHYYEV